MLKKIQTNKGNKPKKDKEKESKEQENPLKYCDKLPTLMEADKLGKKDFTKLCCREHYCLKPVRYLSETDRDDEIYSLFGSLVGQEKTFMRRWLRVFTVTNKWYIIDISKAYFKSKGIKYAK